MNFPKTKTQHNISCRSEDLLIIPPTPLVLLFSCPLPQINPPCFLFNNIITPILSYNPNLCSYVISISLVSERKAYFPLPLVSPPTPHSFYMSFFFFSLIIFHCVLAYTRIMYAQKSCILSRDVFPYKFFFILL